MKLTKENLLKYVYQEEIFEKYLGFSVELGKKYCNPLRDDKNPDCSFYYSDNQTLYFMDFACKDCGGDCWNIVGQYYNCDYYTALRHVNRDFGVGLDDGHIGEPIVRVRTKEIEQRIVSKEKIYSDIKVLTMSFNQVDLDYWRQYEIDKEQLEKFEVFSAFKTWIDNRFYYQWTKKEPQYAYKFDKKTFQLYRPLSSKDKWRTNSQSNYLHGYNVLPISGDLLIWTKSRKDIMDLDLVGYQSVAPPSEGTIPTMEKIKELKQRFTSHVVLFDNDKPGIRYSDKFSQIIEGKQIFMPEGAKDPSDFVKLFGLNNLKLYLNDQTREINDFNNS